MHSNHTENKLRMFCRDQNSSNLLRKIINLRQHLLHSRNDFRVTQNDLIPGVSGISSIVQEKRQREVNTSETRVNNAFTAIIF